MELCQKFGLVGEVKWYNYKPASVVENDSVKILRGFNIQTGHVIEHKRLDRKSEKNVTLFILLCLGTKGLSRKNRKR